MPLGPEQQRALHRPQLHPAGERRLSVRELQHGARQHVDPVVVGEHRAGQHGDGLGLEAEAAHRHRVEPGVVEDAAPHRRLIADVGAVRQCVAERPDEGAQVADLPCAQELARGVPARLYTHHRRLADHHAGPIARGDQPARLGDGGGDRLFTQHVLAGVGGALGPGDVQVVRQRDVDGVDVRVGDQRVVGGVRLGDAVRAREPPRPWRRRARRSPPPRRPARAASRGASAGARTATRPGSQANMREADRVRASSLDRAHRGGGTLRVPTAGGRALLARARRGGRGTL